MIGRKLGFFLCFIAASIKGNGCFCQDQWAQEQQQPSQRRNLGISAVWLETAHAKQGAAHQSLINSFSVQLATHSERVGLRTHLVGSINRDSTPWRTKTAPPIPLPIKNRLVRGGCYRCIPRFPDQRAFSTESMAACLEEWPSVEV